MLIITYALLLSLVHFGFENVELIDSVCLLLRELMQELLLLGQKLVSGPLMLLDDNCVMPLTFGFVFLVAWELAHACIEWLAVSTGGGAPRGLRQTHLVR